MSPARLLSTAGWGIYLSCSWTWCIGMYLPVILLRDFGWPWLLAFAIPNVLRWYWWRINGWGYAVGTLVGLAAAMVVPFLPNDPPLYYTFPAICTVSLIATLA